MKPELLAPAGSFEKLKFAFAYGADAVYLGVPVFSMRARENEFNLDWLEKAVSYTRSLNKKIYFTANVHFRNNKLEPFKKALRKMAALKPDALIIADPGALEVAKTEFPELEYHLSVQQNSLNYASAKFWQQQGIRRIILPRELSLAEIAEIKRHNPDLELETFVHGAICMAYSGRCLISNYLANRDANQGVCAHSCRWNYQVYQEQRLVSANQLNEQQFFLEEEKRPGELLPIAEDENGSFIMSSRDLCALKYLDQLRKSGVSSFKIEGRNKTIYYLAIITRAYRQAITDLKRGAIPDWQLLFKEVFSTANRGFIPGFLLGDLGASTIDYQKRASVSTHQFAGVVRSSNLDTQMVEIEVKNRLQLGDELEFCLPKISADFSLQLEAMYYQDQKPTTVAHGGDQNVFIKLKPAQIKLLHDAQFVVLRKKAENL